MATKSAASNGSSATVEQWAPSSPFLIDANPYSAAKSAASYAPSSAFAPPIRLESPFVAEYAGAEAADNPQAEAFTELVSELSDTEFSEALEDLVNEAAAIAEDRTRFESEDPGAQRMDAERAVRSYLQPLARASEEMLESFAQGLTSVDLSSASESEVDTFLERFQAPSTDLSPVAEQFLGGLLNKAKNAVKAAAKVAGKVASAINLPAKLILDKLKGLVRPLLERVLRTAIGKVPVALQPVAKQLAKKFLGVTIAEAYEGEEREQLASADPAQLEEELDSELAGYMMQGESFEREAAVERSLAEQQVISADPLGELARSRRRFAKRITTISPAEDVGPVVEEFVPAILAALKLGIKVIGRPKVVNFLAGLVGNLIKKYVGPQQAQALSAALVDAGLKLVSLEAPGDGQSLAAGYALGATVEDTINRLVHDAPETAWESEPLLAAYTYEAFQEAAAAHFPDTEIRDELHETSRTNGAWIAAPAHTSRKSHKRFSRTLDVVISPQAAGSVRTFGGVSLRAFLRDRMGITVDRPIRARATLFEAMPGTMLGVVSMNESNVPGLGTAARVSRAQFHPLTPHAAGALFGEPRLGRRVGSRFLAKRGRLAVGQRFYHLDIPGARVKLGPRTFVKGTRPARSSQPRLVLDFPKHEIRICLFLSEADAQKVAGQLRQKVQSAVLLATFKSIYDTMLKVASDHPHGALRVIHESAPTEASESPLVSMLVQTVGPALTDKAREWLLEAINRELEARYEALAAELDRVTADEADGVTIRIVTQSPILEKIRRLLKPGGAVAIQELLKEFAQTTLGEYRLELRPGFSTK